jgi:aryl-alcohol dehydrogenase-like predicted oxidoreductase
LRREKGVTFFDTADSYGPYVNEELVGEALAPLRDQMVIAGNSGWHIEGSQSDPTAGPSRSAGQPTSLRRLPHRCHRSLYQDRVRAGIPIEDVDRAVGEARAA